MTRGNDGAETVRYSFVIPAWNEEDVLPELHQRLATVADGLDGASEMIFVDDGSTDRTFELLISLRDRDPRCKIVRLSRNFGHQAAITAGLDVAGGEAVIVLDADLQDPPELIPTLIARWREGYEVVFGVRGHREGEGLLHRMVTLAFYRFLKRSSDVDLPVGAGDFRLIDRRVLEAVQGMRERRRYVRGMVSWVGFRQVGVPYERPARHAGVGKYSLLRYSRLAFDGLTSFSDAPLRIALACGFAVALASLVSGVVAIALKLGGIETVPGWASLVVVLSFLGGIQLVVLAAVGIYVAGIFDEVKQRPLYVVRESHGLTAAGTASFAGAVVEEGAGVTR
jgi:glycosyltransferase involved in cell wall biosynthesis